MLNSLDGNQVGLARGIGEGCWGFSAKPDAATLPVKFDLALLPFLLPFPPDACHAGFSIPPCSEKRVTRCYFLTNSEQTAYFSTCCWFHLRISFKVFSARFSPRVRSTTSADLSAEVPGVKRRTVLVFLSSAF